MNTNISLKRILSEIKIRAQHQRQIYSFNRSPLRNKEPLLVYQMGKVGSSTIRRSIHALNLDVQPYHLHYMSGIDYMMNICRKQSLPLQDHILSSIYCKKLLKKSKKSKKQINVISLVREPLGKNVSQFFQNIEVVYPEFNYREKVKRLNRKEIISELTDFFINNFVHKDPLVWFDVELKRFTGIDVYESGFPCNQGYKIYENEFFRILIVRLENLNECISDAMELFLGIKNFQLKNENISDQKEYSSLYREIKKEMILPKSYIEDMYFSKMARHFYTNDELDKFNQKWVR